MSRGTQEIGWAPVLTIDVAETFEQEHGQGLPDDTFVDQVIRHLSEHNPAYMNEVDRIANRLLTEEGFDSKARFIVTVALSYALLDSQATVNKLEDLFIES